MHNYFQGTKDTPHHISIGAVLVNDKGEVACHYFKEAPVRNYPPNFYTLMHESIEPNETIEQTLNRGLEEEFSAKATLVRYVGSLTVEFTHRDVPIEKTVLYFLCKLVSISDIRDMNDPESSSEIRWVGIDELIEIMKKQGENIGRLADESKILIDAKRYMGL